MRKSKKKEKKNNWDDGRVIAPMTGEELPPYRRGIGNTGPVAPAEKRTGDGGSGKHSPKGATLQMTKKEERALTRALFLTMLPRLLICLLAFGIVFLLGYLWLTH